MDAQGARVGAGEPEATTCFAPTPDRWALALHRYPRFEPGGPAAIVCAGYACNRHFVDFDDRHSLARYLWREGFDSWVVELRGRGRSQPLRGCRRPHWWTFDDLALTDVPAALAFVRAQVGHDRILWVGHSMGGMILYAYLGVASGGPQPAAVVTIASPVTFPRVASELAHRIGRLLLALPLPQRVPQRAVLGALWQVAGWTRMLEVGMNPENIDRRVVGAALRRAMSNVSRGKLQQLSRWSVEGTFTSADGAVDYRANLVRVRTPMLLLAGAFDQLATPEVVGAAYERLGGEKQMVVVGRGHGFSIDYGHVDLVLGRRAADEVFPLIARWGREAVGG